MDNRSGCDRSRMCDERFQNITLNENSDHKNDISTRRCLSEVCTSVIRKTKHATAKNVYLWIMYVKMYIYEADNINQVVLCINQSKLVVLHQSSRAVAWALKPSNLIPAPAAGWICSLKFLRWNAECPRHFVDATLKSDAFILSTETHGCNFNLWTNNYKSTKCKNWILENSCSLSGHLGTGLQCWLCLRHCLESKSIN